MGAVCVGIPFYRYDTFVVKINCTILTHKRWKCTNTIAKVLLYSGRLLTLISYMLFITIHMIKIKEMQMNVEKKTARCRLGISTPLGFSKWCRWHRHKLIWKEIVVGTENFYIKSLFKVRNPNPYPQF